MSPWGTEMLTWDCETSWEGLRELYSAVYKSKDNLQVLVENSKGDTSYLGLRCLCHYMIFGNVLSGVEMLNFSASGMV